MGYDIELILEQIAKLEALLPGKSLSPFVLELEQTVEGPLQDLEIAVANVDHFRRKKWDSVFDLGMYRLVNYVLVRALMPNMFLETGILHGITSSFILHALRKNKTGKLISIDLPSYYESGPANQDGYFDTLPPRMEPGWVVPDRLRDNWQIRIGRSIEEIPKVFENDPILDIFLHDSEHTYETMTAEFNLAWPHLKPGGVLICDNIDSCNALADFADEVGAEPLYFYESVSPSKDDNFRFSVIVKNK